MLLIGYNVRVKNLKREPVQYGQLDIQLRKLNNSNNFYLFTKYASRSSIWSVAVAQIILYVLSKAG